MAVFGGSRKQREKRSLFHEEALPHLDSLYRYGRHLTRNARDAEDLVQDTMVKAYRFFDSYTPGTNCRAWLFRIMTNTFLKKNRRNVREFSFLDNLDSGDSSGELSMAERSSFYQDPERDMLDHTIAATITDALDDLPADFRTVVLLADLQDLSYKEIAEVMDCPVGTVMSRLHRARKALQKKLVGYATEQGYIQPEQHPTASEEENDTPTSLDEWRRQHKESNGSG